jgi:hypothetical protein
MTAILNAFQYMPMPTPEIERYYDTLAGQYRTTCGEAAVPNGESGARFAQALGGFFSRSGWEVTAPIPLFSLRSLGDFTSYLDRGKNCPQGSPAQRIPSVVAKYDDVKKDVAMTSVIAGSDWQSVMSELGLRGYSGSQTLFNNLIGTIAKLQKALRAGDYDDTHVEALEKLLTILKDPARGRLGYLILSALGGIGSVPEGVSDLYDILITLINDEEQTPGGSGGQSGSPVGGGGSASASGGTKMTGFSAANEVGDYPYSNRPANFWYAPQMGVWNFMPEEMFSAFPLNWMYGTSFSFLGNRFVW